VLLGAIFKLLNAPQCGFGSGFKVRAAGAAASENVNAAWLFVGFASSFDETTTTICGVAAEGKTDDQDA